MRPLNDPHTLPLLRQIPAPNRLVVAHAQQEPAARVKRQRAHPVVVPRERGDAGAARIPQLHRLVARAGGDEFPRRRRRGRGAGGAAQGGDVWVAGGRGEGDALDDVGVAGEDGSSVCGGGGGGGGGVEVPQPRRLVAARADEPAAVQGCADLPHPLRVAPQCAHAVPRCHVPDADARVPARAGQQCACERGAGESGGDEAHARYGVVVAGERAQGFVVVRRVPQPHGGVRGAGRQECAAAGPAKVDAQHGLCVAFERALELAVLPVPDLDAGVLRRRGERGEDGVEGDGCYRRAVALEDVAGWCTGEPGRWVEVAAARGRRRVVHVVLQGGAAGFEVHDLLLKPHHRRPFLLEQAFVLLARGIVKGVWGEGELGAKGGGGGWQVGGGEVGDDGLVEFFCLSVGEKLAHGDDRCPIGRLELGLFQSVIEVGRCSSLR